MLDRSLASSTLPSHGINQRNRVKSSPLMPKPRPVQSLQKNGKTVPPPTRMKYTPPRNRVDPERIKSVQSQLNKRIVPPKKSSASPPRPRSRIKLPPSFQMTVDQAEQVQWVLSQDGNLLVFGGLYSQIDFWRKQTTGRVMFVNESIANKLESNGSTVASDDVFFERYMCLKCNRREADGMWEKELNIASKLPHLSDVKWDVIIVSSSATVSQPEINRYEAIVTAKAIAERSVATGGSATHIFVADYKRAGRGEFSDQVFRSEPRSVLSNLVSKESKGGQAHFIMRSDGEFVTDKDWTVLVSVTYGFIDMFQNWFNFYKNISFAQDVRLVVVAEDFKSLQWLRSNFSDQSRLEVRTGTIFNHTTVTKNSSLVQKEGYSYLSRDYVSMVSQRPRYILNELAVSMHVLYSDIDTVWLSNPLKFMSNPSMDLYFQIDHINRRKPSRPHINICTCFLAWKATVASRNILEDWEKALLRKNDLNQPGFNMLMKARKATLRSEGLPVKEFPSAFEYFKDNLTEGVVLVHNNFIIGKANKIERFKNTNLWSVPEE